MADPIELLVEQVVSAHRELDASGRMKGHPAWHDLPVSQREHAFAETVRSRELEAALDPEGLSTTGRAVLARVRAASAPDGHRES
ncbi:MAG: hypothetical protein L0Y66_17895 [Myxococcaceae bacterium]|nr:hypothetical protein [Myxococcaceae bacterium]MCI0674066.1 hypothetical protein [Myxococcaceae bacterium]